MIPRLRRTPFPNSSEPPDGPEIPAREHCCGHGLVLQGRAECWRLEPSRSGLLCSRYNYNSTNTMAFTWGNTEVTEMLQLTEEIHYDSLGPKWLRHGHTHTHTLRNSSEPSPGRCKVVVQKQTHMRGPQLFEAAKTIQYKKQEGHTQHPGALTHPATEIQHTSIYAASGSSKAFGLGIPHDVLHKPSP